MAKIKEFVKNHKKEIILVGAGVAVGAGVTYVVCKKVGVRKILAFDPTELSIGINDQGDTMRVAIGMYDGHSNFGKVMNFNPEKATEMAEVLQKSVEAIKEGKVAEDLLFFGSKYGNRPL